MGSVLGKFASFEATHCLIDRETNERVEETVTLWEQSALDFA